MLFSSVHIVHMHSFNFIKIFSFDISKIYFYCFAYWLLLSSFLVILFLTTHVYCYRKFFVICSSGFSCFCHRVCSRTGKPQKVLISKLFEVLTLYLILSTFPTILCAQGTTLIKQCSKVSTKTYHWSLKVVFLFLRSNW